MARISRRAALLGALGVGVAGAGGVAAAVLGHQGSAAPPPAPLVETPTPTPTPTPSATTTPVAVDTRPRWPLTGKLLKDPEDAKHAAVAVKVPDNKFEHPQRGIDKADIVFVELEGYLDSSGYSATRLVPVFHSQSVDSVAPVRSIRPVDIPLLSPMDAVIGNTGAAPWVVNYVKHNRAHLEGMLSFVNTIGTGSYGTDRSRIYQYNGNTYYDRAIVCHPDVLRKQTKRFRDGPQQLYFPFAFEDAQISTRQGKKGVSVRIPYKGDDYFMGYEYDKLTERYLRSEPWGPHVMADGTRIAVDNVLIIKAKQHYGKIYKGVGHDEPLHDIIKTSGQFSYFHGGRYVTGTWRKEGFTDPFQFTTDAGQPLRMAQGKTFVELPDTKAKLRIKD